MRQEWGGAVGLDLWAPSRVGDPEFEKWWARLLRQGTSPSGAIALFDLYREVDVRPILPTIRVPTLVLHRRGDMSCRSPRAGYLADHIPDARYLELSGDDHLVTVGDQDALWTRSRSSLSAVGAPMSPNGPWRQCSSPT